MYTEFPCLKIFPLHNFQKRDCPHILAHTFGIGLMLLINRAIGAKPNLYCEAIKLVCSGSPNIFVLVERKALGRAKSEQ